MLLLIYVLVADSAYFTADFNPIESIVGLAIHFPKNLVYPPLYVAHGEQSEFQFAAKAVRTFVAYTYCGLTVWVDVGVYGWGVCVCVSLSLLKTYVISCM